MRNMAIKTKKKARISRFGYGVLALYVFGVVAMMGLGIYGANLTSLMMRFNESERTRAQIRSGKMVVIMPDREQCRSYHFDNKTADVTAETLVECDKILPDRQGSESLNTFQRGFQRR